MKHFASSPTLTADVQLLRLQEVSVIVSIIEAIRLDARKWIAHQLTIGYWLRHETPLPAVVPLHDHRH